MVCFLLRVWRTRKRKLAVAALAATSVALLIATSTADPAAARGGREGKREEATYLRPDGTPVIAVVAIDQQRVTVYDADGPMLRSPVSTGKPGYETPPGIFTILEKKVEHYSNIYYDAAMPYMQRITWSGIALHAGVLPGRPASGGCIRLPAGFAERLFKRTKLGMRVVVVRDDISPVEIVHPALFKPLPEEAAPVTASLAPGSVAESKDKASVTIVDAAVAGDAAPARPRQSPRSVAAAKTAAAADAARKADEARRAAAKTKADASRLARTLRRATAAKARAEARSRRAERLAAAVKADTPAGERAQEAKKTALAALAEAQAELETVKAQAESALDLVARLREEAKAAAAAKTTALEEAKEAQRKLAPVSVLISRKTQRLYVRQAREPLFEGDVTIADADRPLGTYVFTAVGYANAETDLRWSVLSMYRTADGPEPGQDGRRPRADRHAAAVGADLAGAKLALDRVAIPKDAVDRISEIVTPGSSLIVSDEPISRETGKYTDFIVVMSREPQGGLKIRRRRSPEARYRYRRPYYRSPGGWNGPSYWWQ
jgi:hypothetical protein